MDQLNDKDDTAKLSPVQHYAEAFPPLKSDLAVGPESNGNPWLFAKSSKIASIKKSVTTQIVEIPFEERQYKEPLAGEFGSEQNKMCAQIQSDFDVRLEISNNARTRSLTLLVTGRLDNVSRAVSELRRRLQTQSQSDVTVPAEYHRYIIGKQGASLRSIRQRSGCEIYLPREGDQNPNLIRIVGPKESIDKAKHDIVCIYDEMSKKATERVPVPRVYHPFVAGPYNREAERLMQEFGVRINVPPASAQQSEQDLIRVSGDKDSVAQAVARINATYQEVRRRCQTVNVEVSKSLHKFVVGPRGSGLQEILEATGISVEVPPQDDPSETIVLRGEPCKLGSALTKVYEKAESYATASVAAPAWTHRHVIGTGGENLQRLIGLQNCRAQINFLKAENRVEIDGPKEEVQMVQRNLQAYLDDFLSRNTMTEVPVPREFHRHVVGKNGATVNRIREATGCTVRVPADADSEDAVRIEGPPDSVEAARVELAHIVDKLTNERTKDLVIEHQFHRALIGPHGSRVAELRAQYPQVAIRFPSDPASDLVQLRGPREQLARVERHLRKAHAELKEASHEESVRICKPLHREIVGRKGQTIQRLREEIGVRIVLPEPDSRSDIVTVIGREKDVQRAIQRLREIEKAAASVMEEFVDVPHRLHQGLIGHGGKLIRQLQEQYGGVHIHFPSPGQLPPSDRVSIRGARADVKRASAALQQLASERLEDSWQDSVRAKPEFHPFLIGRHGQQAEQLRKATGARVVFPSAEERAGPDGDLLTIIGRKEAVAQAKQILEQRIRALESLAEETVEVERRWHRAFLERRNFYVNQISEEFGGVQVSFPRDAESNTVTVRGPSDCVQAAIARIRELVDDLAARVTVTVAIPARHFRCVIGRSGDNVRDICDAHDVSIKFPDHHHQQQQETASDEAAVADLVTVTGHPEQCELAKLALLELVPVESQLPVPYELHSCLIGRGGEEVRRLSAELGVSISVPPADLHSDCVTVTGPARRVEAAAVALDKRLVELAAERADREARAYQCWARVPQQHHRDIIGPRGATVRGLQQRHGVRIVIPPSLGGDGGGSDLIAVTGYKEKAESAKAEIEQLAVQLADQVTVELVIAHQAHPILIGQRGKHLRDLMSQYGVSVEMPGRNAPPASRDTVLVRGPPAAVDEACDRLLDRASDIIERMIQRGELDPRGLNAAAAEPADGGVGQARQAHRRPAAAVSSAPWDGGGGGGGDNGEEVEDEVEHFPAIGQPAAPAAGSTVWQPAK